MGFTAFLSHLQKNVPKMRVSQEKAAERLKEMIPYKAWKQIETDCPTTQQNVLPHRKLNN